ncbi:MAG: hypothetical protein LUF87_01895 [Alistipes sp.]|nr:hypothetical protein [Alistipes sp.]
MPYNWPNKPATKRCLLYSEKTYFNPAASSLLPKSILMHYLCISSYLDSVLYYIQNAPLLSAMNFGEFLRLTTTKIEGQWSYACFMGVASRSFQSWASQKPIADVSIGCALFWRIFMQPILMQAI